jgi:hypothetical protein
MENKSKKPISKWLSGFEILLLGATAIISALVALLDFLGVLDGIPWLANRIPTLILLVIGMAAAYLVVERRDYLENMQANTEHRIDNLEHAILNSTRTIVDSLEGVEFQKFDTRNELLNYVIKRIAKAHSRIDDLSWSPAISLTHELDVNQRLDKKYAEQVSLASKKISYREVFIFNRPGRIETLEKRLQENSPGYSCAYYQPTEVPLIQFMIIDNEEMIILSDQFPHYYTIRHPDLIKLYSDYYEEIWRKATVLKLGTKVMHEEVEKVRAAKSQIIFVADNSAVHDNVQVIE